MRHIRVFPQSWVSAGVCTKGTCRHQDTPALDPTQATPMLSCSPGRHVTPPCTPKTKSCRHSCPQYTCLEHRLVGKQHLLLCQKCIPENYTKKKSTKISVYIKMNVLPKIRTWLSLLQTFCQNTKSIQNWDAAKYFLVSVSLRVHRAKNKRM